MERGLLFAVSCSGGARRRIFPLRSARAGGGRLLSQAALRRGRSEAAEEMREEGDTSARNLLIEHNLRLVSHIIKKYYSPEAERDDLVSIGTIGLIKAVDTFQAERGIRLTTYASKCIQNELLMALPPQAQNGR